MTSYFNEPHRSQIFVYLSKVQNSLDIFAFTPTDGSQQETVSINIAYI